MAAFEITQRLMALASAYEVKVGDESEASLLVQGTFATSTPKLALLSGTAIVATLRGNLLKTKFIIADAAGAELGVVNFPAVSIRKTMTLSFGGRGYHATSGGVSTEIYQCADNDGVVALELRKGVGLRDRFQVEAKPGIPREIAILTAVAIHSRYYE